MNYTKKLLSFLLFFLMILFSESIQAKSTALKYSSKAPKHIKSSKSPKIFENVKSTKMPKQFKTEKSTKSPKLVSKSLKGSKNTSKSAKLVPTTPPSGVISTTTPTTRSTAPTTSSVCYRFLEQVILDLEQGYFNRAKYEKAFSNSFDKKVDVNVVSFQYFPSNDSSSDTTTTTGGVTRSLGNNTNCKKCGRGRIVSKVIASNPKILARTLVENKCDIILNNVEEYFEDEDNRDEFSEDLNNRGITNGGVSKVESVCAGLEKIITTDSSQSLSQAGSPQSRAFRWLLDEDKYDFCENENETRTIQRYILAILYYSTTNEYTRNIWLNHDTAECNWHHVTCDDEKNITELDIFDSDLNGNIPTEIGMLSELRYLDLSTNYLFGPIPSELGYLTKIEYLYLKYNELTGPIPTELGNLSNLEELWLHENKLSGPIPTELGNLSNLEKLWLHENKLSGPIPTELGNLSNLENLRLDGNDLTGPIPTDICDIYTFYTFYSSDHGFHVDDENCCHEFTPLDCCYGD